MNNSDNEVKNKITVLWITSWGYALLQLDMGHFVLKFGYCVKIAPGVFMKSIMIS